MRVPKPARGRRHIVPRIRQFHLAAGLVRRCFSCLFHGGWPAMMVGAVVTTVGLLTMTWSAVIDRIESAERVLISSAVREQENIAAIVAENLAHVLDRGRRLALTVPTSGVGIGDRARRSVVGLQSFDSAYLRVALYGQHGERIFASSPVDDGNDVREAVSGLLSSDIAEVQTHVIDSREDGVHGWQIPVLFPIVGVRDQPDGALLGVLDLGYLLGLYQKLDIGRTGAISVIHAGGKPLAEMRQVGMLLHPERMLADVLPAGENLGATATRRFSLRGTEHLVSFRAVAGFPLVVAASTEIGEIRSRRPDSHAWLWEALAAITILIALVALWVLANLYRQSQLLQSLKRANGENHELISQLEDEKRRAFDLASNDHLTGLHNRRMFNELAASHLSRARRSHCHYALMYLDLDRFKGVNDTLGHHVGDLLLKKIAFRLRQSLRESDVVGRLGGDEFAVLLTGLEQVSDVQHIAAKLVECIAEPCLDLDGHDLQVAASIGIAIYPRDGQNVDMLCRHADAAMYHAKRAGRGRFAFYDAALNPAGEWRFELEQRLARAIADGELTLHFQPRVRLSDFRITGLEALARWQHPDYGLIYPKDFIDIAEATGDIVALGQWVLRACCSQIAEWRAEGLEPLPIAVNVSPRQLVEADFAVALELMLAEYGISGTMIDIEVTETALMHSVADAGVILRRLQSCGIRIALDDFGNGFSNIGHIRSLPISMLKIDRSFVADLRNRPDDAVIVDSIVTLAHNLRMRVVAEGVESLDQIVHLKAAGCDEVQGYYLSRPVPAASVREFLLHPFLEPL